MPDRDSALPAAYEVHRLRARLDGAAARAVELTLRDGRARVLIVDFADVRSIDASGILGLTRLADDLGDRRIVLAALRPGATLIAQVTHLHELFDIYASVEAAISAVLEETTYEAPCTSPSTSAL